MYYVLIHAGVGCLEGCVEALLVDVARARNSLRSCWRRVEFRVMLWNGFGADDAKCPVGNIEASEDDNSSKDLYVVIFVSPQICGIMYVGYAPWAVSILEADNRRAKSAHVIKKRAIHTMVL